MATATFTHAEQDWDFGTTTYWFKLNGLDAQTQIIFRDDLYGVIESGCDEPELVGADGYPVSYRDDRPHVALRLARVTDEIRRRAAA